LIDFSALLALNRAITRFQAKHFWWTLVALRLAWSALTLGLVSISFRLFAWAGRIIEQKSI